LRTEQDLRVRHSKESEVWWSTSIGSFSKEEDRRNKGDGNLREDTKSASTASTGSFPKTEQGEDRRWRGHTDDGRWFVFEEGRQTKAKKFYLLRHHRANRYIRVHGCVTPPSRVLREVGSSDSFGGSLSDAVPVAASERGPLVPVGLGVDVVERDVVGLDGGT